MLIVKCVKRIKDSNNNIVSYEIIDKSGVTKNIKPNALKKLIINEEIDVVNLQLTTNNRLIVKEHDNKTSTTSDKFEQLRKYNYKQSLTGKIFDFELSNSKIYITKYYDMPNRKEVIIPEFADGIKSRPSHIEITDCDTISLFFECKHVEKVIMHSNIKGSLMALFCGFKGDVLDLSDFDTSNIDDMYGMFDHCDAKTILFGDKFNTSNVFRMPYMFYYSKVKEINFNNSFDTSKVINMEGMFSASETESIKLGDRFYTHNVSDMSAMFCQCSANEIDLGDNFNTSKVRTMDSMFSVCKTKILNLGDKFNTKNVGSMLNMFDAIECDELHLGKSFNAIKTFSMFYMFSECKINKLYTGEKFNIQIDGEIDDVFDRSDIKQVIINQNTDKYTIDALKYLVEHGNIQSIAME